MADPVLTVSAPELFEPAQRRKTLLERRGRHRLPENRATFTDPPSAPEARCDPAARPHRDAAAVAARGNYRDRGKRVLDVAIVLLTLPVTLPLIVLGMLLLAFEGRQILFRQTRLGLGGKEFTMLKLRTMVPGADALLEQYLKADPAMRDEWETTQKLKKDPRITPLGRFLRRSSMDELPQIWHVLTGEMSLVGPRPMMPHQMDLYGDPAPYVAMRPGITGQWQVMERNESDFASRARADRTYEQTCTLRTDLRIILRTVGVVFRGTGY